MSAWAVVQLKRRARACAMALGHTLERFRHFEDRSYHPPSRRPDYWITYCAGCAAAVAVSPDRWADRTMGGRGLRVECPNPVPPSEDEDDDLEVA